jgi:hypothetical protein
MSLNPFAPEWRSGMLYTDKIAALVAKANDPDVWGAVPTLPIVEDLTYEEALAAVQLHPGTIQMVSVKHRDYALCFTALKTASKEVIEQYNINGENFPLYHVPLEHRDEALCLAAAAWCNRALWFWPRAMRTKAMYVKAARLNPSTLKTMESPLCDDPEVIDAAAAKIVADTGCTSGCAKTIPLSHKPNITSFATAFE